MIIELQYPFSLRWKKGYLRKCKKDGRARVDLFNSNQDRTTISYARYLVSVKLGRFLEDKEEVDHIDGDNSNDELSNLQVLQKEDHRLKTLIEIATGRAMVKIRCPSCKSVFAREKRNIFSHSGIRRSKINSCSNSCSAKFYHKNKGINEELLELIGEEQIIKEYTS